MSTLDYSIIGKKFGLLTVLSKDDNFVSKKYTKWICKCDCGNIKSIERSSLISGSTKSCGCQQNKGVKGVNRTHGLSKTRIYRTWQNMKNRCMPKDKFAKNYYYRGIRVCDEWQNNFMSFYEWAMSHGYSDSLSLDRINNDGIYEPSNCRWIAIEEQQSNRSNTVYVEYNGKKWCLRTLCISIGFPYKLAHRRYIKMVRRNQEIDVNKIFTPIQKSSPQKYIIDSLPESHES